MSGFPLSAQLRGTSERLYPSLAPHAWYEVTREEPLGLFIVTGKAGHPEEFVFKDHVEIRRNAAT
jgi:hypothetical protein